MIVWLHLTIIVSHGSAHRQLIKHLLRLIAILTKKLLSRWHQLNPSETTCGQVFAGYVWSKDHRNDSKLSFYNRNNHLKLLNSILMGQFSWKFRILKQNHVRWILSGLKNHVRVACKMRLSMIYLAYFQR